MLDQEMMTVSEVAKHLRIGRKAAYRLCDQPGFPALRVGGQIRIPVGELERWLTATSGRSEAAEALSG